MKKPFPFLDTISKHYFDHNATTPLCAEVVEAIPELISLWGNPSSIHWAGRGPKSILRETRSSLAKVLKCHPLELIFTSGGSESNTTVIQSVFASSPKKHFMCSMVEHPSVVETMRDIESRGAKVSWIPVDADGILDLEFYKTHLNEETALVSVMLANNEFGSVFPVKEMASLAHAKGAFFHTDAVQGLGKLPVDLQELGVDYASFSAHKIYALKGTGVLFVKKNSPFHILIHGGGQERHRRAGTENILGIGALGAAIEGLFENEKLQPDERNQDLKTMRDHFESRVQAEILDVQVTAKKSSRLPNTSSLIIQDVDGEILLMNLDVKGFAVSTGAACSSGSPEPSPALLSIGLSREQAQSSLRVSFGWGNTLQEVDRFVEVLKALVQHLRSLKCKQSHHGVSDAR